MHSLCVKKWKMMIWSGIKILILIAIMYSLATLGYYSHYDRYEKSYKDSSPVKSNEPEVQYAIIACKAEDNHKNIQKREKWDHQFRQIRNLLKSAAMLTKTAVHFHLITNTQEPYDDITNITKGWPSTYQKRIIFKERTQVYYPDDLKHIQDMFTFCVTERLFIADVLPKTDAVISIDTDILFMQPPEILWHHFHSFEKRHVAGVTPCLYLYDERKNMPSYGHTGLNAGVVMLNLTRIRNYPGGWVNAVNQSLNSYKKVISLAEQDILNIIFSKKNKQYAYEVGCEWNYRPKVCSLDINRCPNAAFYGAGIIHGCATTFVNDVAPNFKAVFEAWENFTLGSPITELISMMEEGVQKAKSKKKGCNKLSNIDDVLLKGIKKYLLDLD